MIIRGSLRCCAACRQSFKVCAIIGLVFLNMRCVFHGCISLGEMRNSSNDLFTRTPSSTQVAKNLLINIECINDFLCF